ncbi:hypothetical protein ACSYAD_10910 [Acaryochloris marina NIES-2412]|uniref:hypothetical protein n=1 Tax=Acaryochloris marina TaxID=155978 RepID=UPI00405A1EB5
MSRDRLSQIEKNLGRLRRQLANKEDTLVTIESAEKERIRQQIEDLKSEIKNFEEEYWLTLRDVAVDVAISDDEAEPIVAEIIEVTPTLQISEEVSAEMLALLQNIYDHVSQPEATAAVKLKGVISSFPPFVGVAYEGEIDTEKFLQKYFPTFRRWTKALVKK